MKELKQLGKVNCQEPEEQQYIFIKLIFPLPSELEQKPPSTFNPCVLEQLRANRSMGGLGVCSFPRYVLLL